MALFDFKMTKKEQKAERKWTEKYIINHKKVYLNFDSKENKYYIMSKERPEDMGVGIGFKTEKERTDFIKRHKLKVFD